MAMVIPPSSLLQSPCNDIQYSGSPDTSDDLPILDLFINPNRADEIEHLQETLTSPIKDYIKTLDDILLEKILNLIKFAAQPCFPIPGYSNKNLLKKCEMQGVEIDCAELFRQVITDSGICCGLNNQDVIKKSKYLNMLNLSDTDFSPGIWFINQRNNLKQNGWNIGCFHEYRSFTAHFIILCMIFFLPENDLWIYEFTETTYFYTSYKLYFVCHVYSII